MKFVFFKTPHNKQFNYTPVYYDEQKEKMEKRLQGAEISNSKEYKDALRSKMDHSWKRSQKSAQKYSLIRPVIILIIATILIFLFLQRITDFISAL